MCSSPSFSCRNEAHTKHTPVKRCIKPVTLATDDVDFHLKEVKNISVCSRVKQPSPLEELPSGRKQKPEIAFSSRKSSGGGERRFRPPAELNFRRSHGAQTHGSPVAITTVPPVGRRRVTSSLRDGATRGDGGTRRAGPGGERKRRRAGAVTQRLIPYRGQR